MEKIRVLFLCRQNHVRSQIAHALLRMVGGDRFAVFSAGSEPAKELHPLALQVLYERAVDTTDLYPKHFSIYANEPFDYIITTCIEEDCPVFFQDPERIHWRFADPAAVKGSEATKLQAFRRTTSEIENRVRAFANIRLDILMRQSIRNFMYDLQASNLALVNAVSHKQPARVLVLCPDNAVRSPMAAALLQEMSGDSLEVFSAGSQPAPQLDPEVIAVLQEVGIDISKQQTTSIERFKGQKFDYLITIANSPIEARPTFPNAEDIIHWNISKPIVYTNSSDYKLPALRTLRDDLEQRVRALLDR